MGRTSTLHRAPLSLDHFFCTFNLFPKPIITPKQIVRVPIHITHIRFFAEEPHPPRF